MKYRAEIDGLRAIAVLSVILFHAGVPYLPGGYVGVDIFFVISGYLISTIIFDEMEQRRFGFVDFYERRVRRIMPVLALVLFVSIVPAYLLLQPADLVSFGKSLMAVPAFWANVFFWRERGYFGTATELKPLIHTWSLAVEEQFYLLFPVIALVVFKWCRKYLWLVLTLALAGSLAASHAVTLQDAQTAFFLPHTRAWELLAGSLAALWVRNCWHERLPVNGTLLSGVGLAAIGYAIATFDASTPFPGVLAAIPVAGAFLVIVSPTRRNLVHGLLSLKALVFIGLLSYSLYLWHQPVFAYIHHMQLGRNWLYASLALVLTLSVISYVCVERPFRNPAAFSRGTVFFLALAASAALMAVGLTFVRHGGFVNRYSEADRQILAAVASAGRYSHARFDSLFLADFEEGKRKIFMAGDSYARDVINLMAESDYNRLLSFSTKRIQVECGNIYVPFDKDRFIPQARRARCEADGWFEAEAVKQRMREADEIWLISRWQEWVVPYLGASIEAIKRDYGKPVKVIGIKDFGPSSAAIALRIPQAQRPAYLQPASASAMAVEQLMRAQLPAENFRSQLPLYCGADFQACHLFTAGGELISQDGGHLTEAGAKYLSQFITPLLQ